MGDRLPFRRIWAACAQAGPDLSRPKAELLLEQLSGLPEQAQAEVRSLLQALPTLQGLPDYIDQASDF